MNIGDLIFHAYNSPWFLAVVGLIVINFAEGLAISLYTKTFALAAVGDWLISRAFPYVIIAGCLQGILIVLPESLIPSNLKALGSPGIWAVCCAALLGHFFAALNDIPEINFPGFMTDRPKVESSVGT